MNKFTLACFLGLILVSCAGKIKSPVPNYKKMKTLNAVEVKAFIDMLPVYLKRTTEIKKKMGIKKIMTHDQEEAYYLALSKDRQMVAALKKTGFKDMSSYLTVSFNVFEAFAMIQKMGPKFEQVMDVTEKSLERQQKELDEWKKSSEALSNKDTIAQKQARIDNEQILYRNILLVKPFEGDILKTSDDAGHK